ncbi:MAG: 3-isopropylmalate dehydratase small subunit [Chloroflexi bacterium]|nr:3-isopropylmalate dehydratase small subunit [Chloroflexota bacterium]
MNIQGRVWKYGDDIDTDVIIPARYLTLTDENELGKHCLEDLDPSFVSKVQPGDVILAGNLFGCGSSREHAPIALKGVGCAAVVARSFARIFLRNSINVGLPAIECPSAYDTAQEGDVLEIDLAAGTVTNTRTGAVHQSAPYPQFMLDVLDAGGLVPFTREKLAAERPGG